MRGLLYRDLLGFEQEDATFSSWLEPPRPAYTLIVDLEGSISLAGERLPDAWIGGLSDRYAVVGFDARRYASIDLELTPLGAWSVLGVPLNELEGQTLALEDAFGDAGQELVDELHDATNWDTRFDAIERFLRERAQAGPRPTPAVAYALSRLWDTDGRERVDKLATQIGCSRRYLHARFREQVGLAPKTVARLIRFGAVRRRIERAPAGWADIAYDCGYADQAHLNRDFRELAGTTPTDFVARLLPGYRGVMGDAVARPLPGYRGVMGDGVPFIQD
ncbi:MAG: helix-turn-helix domain-containing protein [Solirubrobacteraceae bacterium]